VNENRKGFISFLGLLFLLFVLGAVFYFLKTAHQGIQQAVETRRSDEEWRKVIFDHFDKEYPKLHCYCTIKEGRKRKKIDPLETVNSIIGSCEGAVKKYPEYKDTIYAYCWEWLALHFDRLADSYKIPEHIQQFEETRNKQIQELQKELTAVEEYLKKYGLLTAVILAISLSISGVLVFRLNRKISEYRELKRQAENELQKAETEAQVILHNAELERKAILERTEKKAREVYRDTLVKAEKRAEDIVNEARDRAEEIIRQAEQYAKELKEKALTEVKETLERLQKENEELRKEANKWRSNFKSPAYIASFVTEDDQRLDSFINALIKQGTAEKVQKELRRAIRRRERKKG